MLPPALTPAETAAFERALTGIYYKRIRVSLLDRGGQPIEDLSHAFMEGQVVVDASQDVDRSTTIKILDPRHQYGFDSDTYQGGDLDLSRMLRIFWVVSGDTVPRAISIPVHTGPITMLHRDGPVVEIEAQGKEVYGLVKARFTATIKKGAKRTDAIKTLLRRYMGETRMSIPDLAPRLADDLVIRSDDQPWKVCQRLAQSLGRQLFYDGSGTCVLRVAPTEATWRFTDGEGGGLTSRITTEADLSDVINNVYIVGRTPKGKKQPVTGQATAAPDHPLSPQNLGPPGAPMALTERVTNTALRTKKECDAAAQAILARKLRLIHSSSFNAVPIPHLDPGDLIRVATDYENFTTQADSFTLPLGIGGDMQVGYTSAFRLRKKRRRKG